MKLSDVIKELKEFKIKGTTEIDITDIVYDSRKAMSNCIFVCISGFKTDGHKYIDDAIKKGAIAVVIEKEIVTKEGITTITVPDAREALALISSAFFDYPSRNIKLIGVTGTNGKTTTTYLIQSILEEIGYKTALLGTIANIIDNKKVDSKNTTPESYELQKMLSEMVKKKTDYCVMEVSSHSLELKRVYGCYFNVGIFTNLTRDHLDFHITFENYLNAKMKLFERSRIASVNIDDYYSDEILKRLKIPVITYSEKKDADIKALNVEITSKCSKFDLKFRDEIVPIILPLPGRFNVYNALAAASACIEEGISVNDIKRGLENVKGILGRSEVIDSGKGFTIIVDYAHTPDGLENILNTVKEYAKARIITVFGCGGDRDKTKRPEMGKIAANLSDICIVTSDNPRSEEPVEIINDILPGIVKENKIYQIEPDRKEAIKIALSIARKEDVVVIAGKGHETYQILKDNRIIHFDEREVIEEILSK